MSRRRKDERGAVMVIAVLLLSFLLIGVSAFTLDLGTAYVSKRNLQKAADAGALAAAQRFTQFPGTCAAVLANPTALALAQADAQRMRDENRSDKLEASRDVTYTPSCVGGNIVVTYEVEGDTTSIFGPFLDSGDEIETSRSSQAVVEVSPTSGTNMRPLAMCSTQLTAGPFVRLDYPKLAPVACGNASGAWWTVDCPGNASNSTSVMVQQVRNGCPKGVSVVSGTEGETATELTTTLEAACLGGQSPEGGCLESNPGNLDSGQVAQSWKYLVQNNVKGVFPVFCAPPQCSSSTIEGSGNNATFPVYKLLSAVICGYHFSKTEKFHSSSGECTGLPSNMYAGNDESGNTVNYLIIKYVTLSGSSSNQDSECTLGAGCDGGVRRTRLTQ